MYAKLELLRLLADDARAAFFAVVAQQLCAVPPLLPAEAAQELTEGFGLDFAAPSGEPAELLLVTKLVLVRAASRAYQRHDGTAAVGEEGAALQSDLVAAGLAPAAAEWVREAAEAAVSPCAEELRVAQSHATAGLSHDYLSDLDWQVNYVLGSSELARVHAPLVQLQLRVRKAEGADGAPPEVTEHLELTPADLDATLDALANARTALKELPAAEPPK